MSPKCFLYNIFQWSERDYQWNGWLCLIGYSLWSGINLYHMSCGFRWRENWEKWQPHFPSLPQGSSIHSLWSVPSCMLSLCLPATHFSSFTSFSCFLEFSQEYCDPAEPLKYSPFRSLKLKVADSLISHRLTTNHVQRETHVHRLQWAPSHIPYVCLVFIHSRQRDLGLMSKNKMKSMPPLFLPLHLQQTLYCYRVDS